MNAVVSGQAQTALLINDDKFLSFDINVPDVFVPRRETDIRFLFGEAKDLRFIENTNYEDVLKQLQFDFDKTSTLDLTLLLLDSDVSNAKQEISEALEELFEDERLIIYLESIFYAKPLPIDADIERALEVCERNAEKVYRFLSTLKDKQEDIHRITEVWNGISIEVFGSNEIRADFQSVFVHEGIFREVVIYSHDPNKINSARVKAGISKSINSLPNQREVLQAFFAPLRQDRVSKAIIKSFEDEPKQDVEERYKEPLRIDRGAVKDSALGQIAYIENLLKERDIDTARKFTNELIDFQQERGEPVHLVKSLCSLAQSAKKIGFNKFQLELTGKAVDLLYSDAWAWSQHGDALLRNNRLDEAIKAFENAISFYSYSDKSDTKVVARNGYAEVLKAKGKLNEALEVYQQIMDEHPEDVVARNGYAEVLKTQGKLNEAVKIYQQIMDEHPEDVVARNGYCSVLFALGRFNEVLERLQNEDLISTQNWVGYHIRGMALLRIGRINEAIHIFESGEENDPISASKEYFRTALAVALLTQREFKKANDLLEKVTSPLLQPKTNILRLHVFGELKEFEKAEVALGNYELATAGNVIAGPWLKNEHQLVDELKHRYISRLEPTRSNEWVFEREVELLALAP